MPAKKSSVQEGPERLAMDSALLLLKFRGRSEAELAKRLAQKKYEPDVVRKTIDRLRELGLLNDEKMAQEWVHGRRKAGQGEIRIRQTLWKRGIPRELIDKALKESPLLEEAEGEIASEPDRAWEALQKRAKRVKDMDRQTLYRRLGGYLARQGFSPDVVHDTVSKYFSQLKQEVEEDS